MQFARSLRGALDLLLQGCFSARAGSTRFFPGLLILIERCRKAGRSRWTALCRGPAFRSGRGPAFIEGLQHLLLTAVAVRRQGLAAQDDPLFAVLFRHFDKAVRV